MNIKRVVERGKLAQILQKSREDGKKVVFTNGCFDILHRGHVNYLQKAAKLGDILVVAVNDDASVSRLKGPQRPVNKAEDRAFLLAALRPVDYVTIFHEDKAIPLLELLKPDVYVKGGDYTLEQIPEVPTVEAYGGEVCVLGGVSGYSTTHLLKSLKK